MANNEDYLDSLLKAASSQIDPNSAINKVRKIESERALEEAKQREEEIDNSKENENEELLSKLLDSVAQEDANETVIPEDSSITERKSSDEDVNLSEQSPVDDVVSDNEQIRIDEEFSTIEQIPADETVSVTSLDSFNENIDEFVPDTFDSSTEAKNENDLPVTEESSDIDSLLKSDFEGEIDVADIAALLDSADEYANSENSSVSKAEVPEAKEDTTENVPAENRSEDDALSVSDIESMLGLNLTSTEESAPKEEMEIDLADMASLEESLGIFEKNDNQQDQSADDIIALTDDGGELAEISSLLKTFDNNDVDDSFSSDADMLALINEAVSNQEKAETLKIKEEHSDLIEPEFNDSVEKKTKKKKGLFSFLKKKKSDEQSENDEIDISLEPKKGKLAKFFEFLTASDEDDEDNENLIPAKSIDGESKDAGFEEVQGENKEILDEIDKEDADGKKKKKKKKKGKKGKAAQGGDADEADEDGETSAKPKKEKKERKPLVLDIDTGKPLSKRNIKLVAVLAVTLLLAIILFVKLVPSVITHSNARKAYYLGDYKTTYESFFAEKKLRESDEILFNRSKIVLKVTHKYDAFRSYRKMNMEMEALDQLLQAVASYESWLFQAESYGAATEFNEAYKLIIDALLDYYGINEDKAKSINALETDLEYSIMVYSIVNHREYIDPDSEMPGAFIPPADEPVNSDPVYEDMLDEEGL